MFCLLYPACFNKCKVIYVRGSFCHESSCDASFVSEEATNLKAGVVGMRLLLAVKVRQPIHSGKTVSIPVPYKYKEGILFQSLTSLICVLRLYRDHQCMKSMWLWRQCQGGTVEIFNNYPAKSRRISSDTFDIFSLHFFFPRTKLRIPPDICYLRMTDIESIMTIFG